MDVLERAKTNFKKDKDSWSSIYKKAKEDLHFISDDPCAQWDEQDYNNRVQTGRPALTIDQLGQFIHQVANDIRMNTPSINVIPANSESSEQVAEVCKGLIREIEYYSNADDVYDTASLNSIRCGIGFIRVDFEYEEEGFEQRLCIKRVVNPLACWIDSGSIECDGRDAKRGYVIDKYSISEFKSKWPDKATVCFEHSDVSYSDDEDEISVCEYFEIEEEVETITSEDGTVSRDITKKTVKRYIMSGADILEEGTFPSKYIPLIPVYGEEAWIDGKRQLYSLIRKSKSAQQMFNYWKSLETELLMKAPQAPVMAAEGQVEDYADDWKNPSKSMVLRYKTTDAQGNPVAPPQRLEPPTVPIGIVNAAQGTKDDIKATMGIYSSGLGERSNETSGIAIQRRQQEGDVATFHFQDNLIRSITQLGRILVSAIPEVYTGGRILRILGMEDEPVNIGVNGALAIEQPQTIDLSQGRYDVRVKTGGSYTTRRQEAADFLSNLINVSPEMMQIMGDLLFENLDFSGANVMAERMKKVVDPKFLEEGQDPQVAQLTAQLQEMAAIIEGLQAQLQSKQEELAIKAQGEQNDAEEARVKAELQVLELRLKQEQQKFDSAIKSQELQLKERELALKEAELQIEAIQGRSVVVT